MPQTRSQRASQSIQSTTSTGLLLLGDDALRNALTFLSVADCRCGIGAASKALRAVVSSNQLSRARETAPYLFRGNEHGAVHALATAFGTREWPRRQVTTSATLHDGSEFAAIPPPRLDIRIHRVVQSRAYESPQFDEFFRSMLVDQGEFRDDGTPADCSVRRNSYVEYQLPFQLRISRFRLSFGKCASTYFCCWVFELTTAGRGLCYMTRVVSLRGLMCQMTSPEEGSTSTSRPSPRPAFAFGMLRRIRLISLSACTYAAWNSSARSSRPGGKPIKNVL